MSAVLRWEDGANGSIARISKTDALPFYQVIPTLRGFQLLYVTLFGAALLGEHPTEEEAQAVARTHVGDDE